MRRALPIFSLIILLVGCSAPTLPPPAPTPEAIYTSFPPVLKPWGDKLSTCATINSLTALYYKQYSPSTTELSTNDIVFSLGEPDQYDQAAVLTQVGQEKVVVVVNRANELSELSLSQLQAIISGQTAYWENSQGNPIQVWVYPTGDPARLIFDQAIESPNRLATNTMLAPDLDAMLEAISGDENSIGYLTKTFLSSANPSLASQVKILPLDSSLDEKLSRPVIALTQGEPAGLVRELLVCLASAAP